MCSCSSVAKFIVTFNIPQVASYIVRHYVEFDSIESQRSNFCAQSSVCIACRPESVMPAYNFSIIGMQKHQA